MIRVDRQLLGEPAVLATKGSSEQKRAIAAFLKHIEDGKSPEKFKFNFRAYTERELKDALTLLFHGKCAYCESRYAGSQPMDVEHWRPKGQVDLETGSLPGYYWLAATWGNLLPSCIDCNRSRRQYDPFLQQELLLGKEAQFPVLHDKHLVNRERPHEHDEEGTGGAEVPLLVNPCLDEPSDYFRYQDGLILPRGDLEGDELEKAKNSIRVYALNRSGLVWDRLAVARLIEQRFFTLESLQELASKRLQFNADRGTDPQDDVEMILIDELIAHEIECLLEMQAPDRAFSAMATQLVQQKAKELDLVDDKGSEPA